MSIFTISDLHLSFGTDKPMNIFRGWDNHTERLMANWNRLVGPQDIVVLPGDFSWALKLEETKSDFQFLKKLNGKKIILKGNHDLWWSTVKKLNDFFSQNEISDVEVFVKHSGKVLGKVTVDPFIMKARSVEQYELKARMVLDEKVTIYDVLMLLNNDFIANCAVDMTAKGTLRVGLSKTIKKNDVPLKKLIEYAE